MRNIQPDDFVAADGSIQTLTTADYAEAADAMLSATENPDVHEDEHDSTSL